MAKATMSTLLLALLAAAAAGAAHGQTTSVDTTVTNLAFAPAAPAAGDSITIIGTLAYSNGGAGPAGNRIVTCTDTTLPSIFGTGQVRGTSAFLVQ